ncbi:NAD(P)-binding domain-containing protein, partial [Streptomyces sp. SID7760]|nr:NAD(P)-binding domain-containing protein [Streptomyces sp. SID7760]
MRTGVIGTGRIGSTLARILVAAGHEVVLANARGPHSLGPLVAELGPAASAAHPAEAADQAELLVLMVPYASVRGLLPVAAVQDKVLVDATNAFGAGGRPADLGGRASSELVAEWYPGARVVKSLNTMHFETLAVAGGPFR